ncbi:hypothetical protein MY3296_005334 [Beauveria thailandica]
MSRFLRQTGQLTRLLRVSQQTNLQRGIRLSVSRATATPILRNSHANQIRCFASEPPRRDEDQKPIKDTDEKTNEQNKADNQEDGANEEGRRQFPLPNGWIYLSKEEIKQMQVFYEVIPESQRPSLDEILKGIQETGAPAEIRDILAKLRKGPGNLSIMDKGRLMRCVFAMAERLAAWEVERENRQKGHFTQNKVGEDGPHHGNTQSQNQNQGRPSDDHSKTINVRISLMQTVLLLGIILYSLDSFGGSMSQKQITWQEMRKAFLDKGLVQKLVVVNGSQVRVELHPSADQGDDRRQYVFSIGSVESFEKKLEEAQDQLGVPQNERIPVSYEAGGSTIGNILLAFGPTLLFIGLILYTQRSMGGRGGAGGMFNFGKSKAKKFNAESAVKVKFADVAGLEEAKTEIMEFVSFLKQPEKFEKLGAKIPRGAILAGPPGTGKTLLAKATAGESGVPFFSVSGSEFVEMFVGVGPSRVRDLFAEGRKNAPCIIFIDEIDAIGRARQDSGKGFGGNDEREATLNQILTEMDGFNTREQVVVLAGTNRADVLDKALMRPGRFDRHIYVDRPTMSGRQEIFRVYLKKIVTSEDIDHLVGRLSTLTPGFSGADISNVVNEAALIAARANAEEVKMEHFERAIERVIGGLERKSLVLKPLEKRTVAYHEAGHAICGWFLEHADPLLKVSIIPRGQGALGYAQYLPQDAYLMSTNQLMDRMAMTMGGRVSEELHFPTVTTGASDDFKKVSQMARSMVTQWGMSDVVGPVHFDNDPNRMHKPFAESTAQQIDQEVHKIVEEAYKRCKDLLTEKKKEVGLIAQELLKKEVLVRDDMVRILGKRPFEDNEDFEKYFGGSKEESAPPPFPGEGETPAPGDSPQPSPAFKELSRSEQSRL